jgi:hypothetical protein
MHLQFQANTVRITENFASNTEKQYLADLEKELKKPDPITDFQKEKKIADTLAKLVTLIDVAEIANKWYDSSPLLLLLMSRAPSRFDCC